MRIAPTLVFAALPLALAACTRSNGSLGGSGGNGVPADGAANGAADLGGGGTGGGGGGGTGGGGGPVTPAACSGKAAQPLDGTWTLHLAGGDRTVEVHVPSSYDPTRPTPLVLNFHGYTSNGMQQALVSNMNPKADSASFVVAYPEGTGSPTGFNAGACCGQAAQDLVDDVGFARALIAEADTRLCLDGKRVFVTGFSNGGFMSHRIACELADVVAAVAPVSGVLGIPAASCAPVRPISVIDFHGMSDTTVPYGGDASSGWPSAPDTFAAWAARDQCSDAAPAQSYSNGDATCATYSHCAGGTEVTLCTISDGGHAWPGSPIPLPGTTQNLSATDAMWTFFQAHPLP